MQPQLDRCDGKSFWLQNPLYNQDPSLFQTECPFVLRRTIGQGTYSVVKEVKRESDKSIYAAKIISKSLMQSREHMVKNEIAILLRLSQGHRHILTMVDFFETPNNLYIITEIARGGELFDRICNQQRYSEIETMKILGIALSTVAYLHKHNIVHRDLKPENFLFRSPDDGSDQGKYDILIADFGLSKIIDSNTMHNLNTTCGTPSYMAPEVFTRRGHGKPVDMWAIGVITYFLLVGYTPFDRRTNVLEMQAIIEGDYKFEPEAMWSSITDTAKEFIAECLNVEPNKRITAEDALDHKFFKFSRFGLEYDPRFDPKKLYNDALERYYELQKNGRVNGPLYTEENHPRCKSPIEDPQD